MRATSFLGPHKFVVTVRESRKATYTVEVFGEVQKQDNNTYSPVIYGLLYFTTKNAPPPHLWLYLILQTACWENQNFYSD